MGFIKSYEVVDRKEYGWGTLEKVPSFVRFDSDGQIYIGDVKVVMNDEERVLVATTRQIPSMYCLRYKSTHGFICGLDILEADEEDDVWLGGKYFSVEDLKKAMFDKASEEHRSDVKDVNDLIVVLEEPMER